MKTLEPNVERETSTRRMKQRTNFVNNSANLLDKISWIVMKKERPPKTGYYPLPPRK